MLIIFAIFLYLLVIFALACFFIVIKIFFSLLSHLFGFKNNKDVTIHNNHKSVDAQPSSGIWAQVKRNYIAGRDNYKTKHGTKTFSEVWEQFKKDYAANYAAYKKKHDIK